MGQERVPPPDKTDFLGQEEKVFSAFVGLYRSSALGTQVKGILHNLNGSLQILSMQVELLQGTFSKQREDLNASAQEKLERCQGQIEKMRTVVEILSRRGSEEEGPRTVYVNDLIGEELSFLNHNLFFKHEVEVRKSLGLKLPPLRVDPADLRDGLSNLLLNAIEAMESASRKELTVRTELESGQLRVVIRDTGCGIPEEVRRQLFQPFFTTKGGRHQGLGLFLARRLLIPWGGSIQFSSREGETIFSVTFPVSSAE